MNKKDNIVIFDIETDGHDFIVQIGYIICNKKLEIIKNNEILIYDGKRIICDYGKKIPQCKIKETGIHPIKALKMFFDDLIDCDTVVGHNINTFDIIKIKDFCKKYKIDNKLPTIKHDTICVGQKYFNKRPKLSELYTYLTKKKINEENAHTALYDTQITFECYKILKSKGHFKKTVDITKFFV